VDVLIVGAGFMGQWLAYFLTKDRSSAMSVLVVERDHLGYGASTRNAGFLSSGNMSEWLLERRDQGQEATLYNYAARRRGVEIVLTELGAGISFDQCGSADFDPTTDEATRLAETFNEFVEGGGSPAPFRRRSLTLGGHAQEVWFNADDYAINPVEVLHQLHLRAAGQGVQSSYETEIVSIGDGLATVKTANGRCDVSYRHAFVCTNAFARDLHPATDITPARGQILVTRPCKLATTQVLGFMEEGHDYFRFVDGRLLVGGDYGPIRRSAQLRPIARNSGRPRR